MHSLTSLLARDGLVPLDTIEQALQRQVLEGGELDTALLELSTVPENVLGAYRAASLDLPAASRAQLERIPRSLLERVPVELAREYRVLPIAFDGDTLTLATAAPPPLVDVQRLARELKSRVTFRIATELRIHVALAAHYRLEIPSRLRLLHEKLLDRDPGELREVLPWAASRPAPPREPEPSEGERVTSRAVRSVAPPPVRVVPVLALGTAQPSVAPPSPPSPPPQEPAEPQPSEDARATSPERPSSKPPRVAPAAAPPAPVRSAPPARAAMPRNRPTSRGRRSRNVRRGPLTRDDAIDLLGEARDRDRVLEVFFAFARQYFECSVLFALRDERLLGLEGAGLLSTIDLRAVEVALVRSGNLHALTLSRSPRVLDLRASAADRALVEAIGRGAMQPCVVIPVSIGQRIVSLLYGDRGGEPLELAELSDLLQVLPAVSTAFGRIIHERKLLAVEAHDRGPTPDAAPEAAPPEGAFGSSGAPPRPTPPRSSRRPAGPGLAGLLSGAAPAERARSRRSSPQGAAQPIAQPPSRSGGALHGDLPAPPRLPAEARGPAAESEPDMAERPTTQLSSEAVHSGLMRAARASSPSKSMAYSQHDAPADQVRARRRAQETTRPERPSRIPPSRSAPPRSTSRKATDPPPPRTLAQPAPGTGSYALHEAGAEVAGSAAQDKPPQPPHEPPTSVHPKPEPAGPRSSRIDPRREQGRPPVETEVVSISQAVRDSLRPLRSEPEESGAESIVVDMGAEAERLVEELCRCGPDEERPLVASLLRLGADALAVLKRRFPGPLWFDRHKPRQRSPAGRDVSAIARVLFAFEERAVPVVAELLESPQLETRMCALLLAIDTVRPELLWPLYQRLFDSDGQIRLLAFDALPIYRHVAGFPEVLKSLRSRAGDEREPVPARLSALEAISILRDPASVELLIALCRHTSRELSVPAHRALLAITAQDFGDSDRKWRSWLDKNQGRHRVEWLIDSLMHGDERVRNTAGVELQKTTQVYYGFVAGASKRDRERAQRRYREWWQNEGRAQFEG